MSLCPQRGHHYIHLWIHCISIDARTHTHTSIFKHAASAWRHDTTTPEPKYIQGHSGIASQLMETSLFHLLAPFIFQLVSFLCVFLYKYVCHSSYIAYAYFCMCFLNKLEGPGHLESLKVISGYLRAESWCPIAIAAPAVSAVVDRISNQLWRDPFLLACLDTPHPRLTKLTHRLSPRVLIAVPPPPPPPPLFWPHLSLSSGSFQSSPFVILSG